MKFTIANQTEMKLLVTTYSKYKLSYKEIYEEFDKIHTSYKECRKVNFRASEINGKYGKCWSLQFNLLLKW